MHTKQDSAFIVLKTPTFKYADMGFVYENKDELRVEIYGSGQALMTLTISDDSICMSLFECMSKNSFNKKILDERYPKDILENIFRAKPIFKALNISKTNNGFTQKIVDITSYNIDYSVLNKEVIFHDTVNSILIKIKRMK